VRRGAPAQPVSCISAVHDDVRRSVVRPASDGLAWKRVLMQSADIVRVTATRQPVSDRLIEMAWLVGLVVLPLVFTPRRVLAFYSEPKHTAVHLLALVVVVAWV
jgi:hypothetical protein